MQQTDEEEALAWENPWRRREKQQMCSNLERGGNSARGEKRRFDYNGVGIDLDAALFTYLGRRHVSEAGSVLFFGSDRFHDSLGIK